MHRTASAFVSASGSVFGCGAGCRYGNCDSIPARSSAFERRLEETGDAMSDGLSKCPRCGGELEYDREAQHPVRECHDVALVRVHADVCSRCGDRLFNPDMTERLARARKMLKTGGGHKAVGHVHDLNDELAA